MMLILMLCAVLIRGQLWVAVIFVCRYDPIKGAQDDGVVGFFKGVGKGLVGVVAKPTAGVVDFASNTLQGIGNTAGYFLDGEAKVRPRPCIYSLA